METSHISGLLRYARNDALWLGLRHCEAVAELVEVNEAIYTVCFEKLL